MTILIANLGTSDLAIKIDEFYIPIGFDRNEPNIDESGLTEKEKNVWERELRQEYIIKSLCPELGVEVYNKGRYSFRDLTHKILEAYKADEEKWQERIRPGRIWGVIKTAMEPVYNLREVYLFVTDQPETEKKGYPSDSINLFYILRKWFGREIPKLNLNLNLIPKNIPANNEDEILNHYYNFFHNIDRDETVLISIKGGTPQMQNALRIQGIASGISHQLFINPQLSIKNILAGKASQCALTSYWRYMRSQKYQTITILLQERWDFDGATQILSEWESILDFFIQHQVIGSDNIESSLTDISRVITILNIAINCFNLDIQSAKKILQEHSQVKLSPSLIEEVDQYNIVLNLYTQCRIYWELNQVANFLSRMSSFYEGVLEYLAEKLDCNEKFIKNLKRKNRPNKLKCINDIVQKRNIPTELSAWKQILDLLKSLDYWCSKRNRLIHGAEGISKDLMKELFQQGEYKDYEHYRDFQPYDPDKILDCMTSILQTGFNIIPDEYRRKFLGDRADYYIYSGVKDWAIATLKTDGLQ